jgi:hypothetical protein
MAPRSTRNKIKWQLKEGIHDLEKGEGHLTSIAALADDKSKFIDDNLPQIIAMLELVIQTVKAFEARV